MMNFGVNIVIAAIILVVGIWLAKRLKGWTAKIMEGRGMDIMLATFLSSIIHILLVVFVVIAALGQLGIQTTSLIAVVGAAGLAIGLALQSSLANFASGVMIIALRPFKVGDWIIVGDKVDGDVEQIGFRSTKVRTWPKTLMSIPNKVLATEIIDNWSRMPKRRVKMTVGVTYATTPEQMEENLAALTVELNADQMAWLNEATA